MNSSYNKLEIRNVLVHLSDEDLQGFYQYCLNYMWESKSLGREMDITYIAFELISQNNLSIQSVNLNEICMLKIVKICAKQTYCNILLYLQALPKSKILQLRDLFRFELWDSITSQLI